MCVCISLCLCVFLEHNISHSHPASIYKQTHEMLLLLRDVTPQAPPTTWRHPSLHPLSISRKSLHRDHVVIHNPSRSLIGRNSLGAPPTSRGQTWSSSPFHSGSSAYFWSRTFLGDKDYNSVRYFLKIYFYQQFEWKISDAEIFSKLFSMILRIYRYSKQKLRPFLVTVSCCIR